MQFTQSTGGAIIYKANFTHTEHIMNKSTWKLFHIEEGHKLYCQQCGRFLVRVYKPKGEIQTKCPYCKTMNGYKIKKQNVICDFKYRYEIKNYFGLDEIYKNEIENVHYFNCYKCDNLLMRYKLYSGKVEIKCINCGAINGAKLEKNENEDIIHKRYLKGVSE